MNHTTRFTLLVALLLFVQSCVFMANAKRMVTQANKAAMATENLANPNKGIVLDYPLGYYFFYYGDFSASNPTNMNTPTIVKQFVLDISNTAYMNILSQYTSGTTGKPASIATRYIGETFITGYPFGKTISTGSSNCLEALLRTWIQQYNINVDPTVQYYVVISSEVQVATGGVCGEDGNTCGYHTKADQLGNAKNVLWGYINSNCAPDGPYDEPTNAVLDTLSHEIFETVSDPFLDAWQTSAGKEIGDLCEDGQYGTTYPSQFKAGAKYNLKFNGHEYMVQTEWSNEVSACVNYRNFTTPPTQAGTPAATVSPSVAGSVPKSKAPTDSSSWSLSSLPSVSTGASAYATQSVPLSASVPKSPKVTSSASVPTTPSSSALPVFPSANPSVSTGSSASPSAPIPASPSVDPSQSIVPSHDPVKGACLQCYRPRCHRFSKIKKLCNNKFGGTFTVTNSTDTSTGATACCTNLSNTTASFGWNDLTITDCEYPGAATKKKLFCLAIGGHITCSNTIDKAGVRYTCTRSG